MEQEFFNSSDLRLCDWQYTIRWENIHDFNIGQIVFLKSNPECPMIVCGFINNKVLTTWNNVDGKAESSFPPECLLQYKYACLLTGSKKYNVCLN